MAGCEHPTSPERGEGPFRACAQRRGPHARCWHPRVSPKRDSRTPIPLPLAATAGRPAPGSGWAVLGKGKPAYSSDGIRCGGFRPAEAGEGACGPLRSPERSA
jgi:hypothetical protein